MSRGQEGQTFDTSKQQNQGYYDNAQNSYSNAQQDVGDFEKQLSAYASANPYKQGGEFQTNANRVTANTSDAAARSAGNALQSQALRTGQNSAGAIAATEAMQQQNTRDLSAEQAAEGNKRIGNEAEYNKGVLSASAEPAQMETSLAGQQGQLGEGTLGVQEKAAETPSWMDEFGNSFAQSLGKGAAAGVMGA
jgi:hypothetical protein